MKKLPQINETATLKKIEYEILLVIDTQTGQNDL